MVKINILSTKEVVWSPGGAMWKIITLIRAHGLVIRAHGLA